MATVYEWDVEELEEAPSEANEFDPDIRDHNILPSFKDAKEFLAGLGPEDLKRHRIVLVRQVGNDIEGETDRAWAYLKEDGTLPDTFDYAADQDSGIPVPKRFHAEVAR